jgi:hypothetical protein
LAPERKGLEATAITLYRLQYRRSPSANFGGMPAGYRNSTGNNAHLVATGRRLRGGPDPQAPLMADSAPVAGEPGADPQAADWMSWPWSPWTPVLAAARLATGVGLYRLRCDGIAGLVYLGQGRAGARIRTHLAKAARQGHRQALHFSGDLAASWVALPGMATRNLLEHENDLIAAHVLSTGHVPTAQFLG